MGRPPKSDRSATAKVYPIPVTGTAATVSIVVMVPLRGVWAAFVNFGSRTVFSEPVSRQPPFPLRLEVEHRRNGSVLPPISGATRVVSGDEIHMTFVNASDRALQVETFYMDAAGELAVVDIQRIDARSTLVSGLVVTTTLEGEREVFGEETLVILVQEPPVTAEAADVRRWLKAQPVAIARQIAGSPAQAGIRLLSGRLAQGFAPWPTQHGGPSRRGTVLKFQMSDIAR